MFALTFVAQAVLTNAQLAFDQAALRANEVALRLGTDSDLVLYFGFVIRLGLAAMLVWLVWARASRWAALLATIWVFGRIFQLQDAITGISRANWISIVWTIEFTIGLVAIAFLVTSSARYWFATKGQTVKGDAAIFD